MLFYSKLKDLYHKLILSKYIIVHNYRIPPNYNNTSTQFVNNAKWIYDNIPYGTTVFIS